MTETTVPSTSDRFSDLHERTYNFTLDDPVEVVNLRLTATHQVPKPEMNRIDGGESLADAKKGTRAVDFDERGEREANVYERERLPSGATAAGPLIVEEPACTTLVTPNQALDVDEYENLRISDK